MLCSAEMSFRCSRASATSRRLGRCCGAADRRYDAAPLRVARGRRLCDSAAVDQRQREDEQAGADRRTAALVGLAIILALAIIAVVLVRELRKKSALEDCLMSGRTNCAPIDTPSRD